jgi:hypothetical protein
MSKNYKMQEKTLNCIKKTEAPSLFEHYKMYAPVKFGMS